MTMQDILRFSHFIINHRRIPMKKSIATFVAIALINVLCIISCASSPKPDPAKQAESAAELMNTVDSELDK